MLPTMVCDASSRVAVESNVIAIAIQAYVNLLSTPRPGMEISSQLASESHATSASSEFPRVELHPDACSTPPGPALSRTSASSSSASRASVNTGRQWAASRSVTLRTLLRRSIRMPRGQARAVYQYRACRNCGEDVQPVLQLSEDVVYDARLFVNDKAAVDGRVAQCANAMAARRFRLIYGPGGRHRPSVSYCGSPS